MSAPIENVSSLTEVNMETESELYCVIEAKVPTGFEEMAKGEAIEKLNAEATIAKGRINIHLPIKDVPKVLKLMGIDNCYVLMTQVKDFPFVNDELESMAKLRELVKEIDWEMGLKVWKMIYTFKHPIVSKPEVIPESLGEATLSSRIHKPQKGDNKKDKWTKKKGKRNRNEAGNEKSLETSKSMSESGGNKDNKEENESECNHGNSDTSSQGNTGSCSHINSSDNTNEKGLTSSVSDGKSDIASSDKTADITQSNQDTNNSNIEDEQPAKRQKLTEYDPLKPTFRVTCNRSGENHSFDSMGAACNFGSAIYNYFHWNVDMKNFDIEVVLNIDENDVRVCLALTKESLHKRNLVSFGITTLRPTIAYNLLRTLSVHPEQLDLFPVLCKHSQIEDRHFAIGLKELHSSVWVAHCHFVEKNSTGVEPLKIIFCNSCVGIKPGDIVCDPMCGSGSIPVQK
ncbi:hypothetical protein KUTeg_020068 [Tegillarca granosa]|uniref:THUMP domain-containing protein n=1 Tax=Tegillarca granosa TaxID=220873 RepID=A0ABQ9E9J2_TEGGR|nr:hypothetical protein KUTeg_020068 [Tegillarca granosa]